MESCEDRVAIALYEWLSQIPNTRVVSFHPPSGKAYDSDLLRIPKRVGRMRTRERYHVDVVFINCGVLFLIELKCRLSECDHDILKLREIRDSNGLKGILELIQKRSTGDNCMKDITDLVLGLGFEIADSESIPPEFITFCTSTSPPTIRKGRSFPTNLKIDLI